MRKSCVTIDIYVCDTAKGRAGLKMESLLPAAYTQEKEESPEECCLFWTRKVEKEKKGHILQMQGQLLQNMFNGDVKKFKDFASSHPQLLDMCLNFNIIVKKDTFQNAVLEIMSHIRKDQSIKDQIVQVLLGGDNEFFIEKGLQDCFTREISISLMHLAIVVPKNTVFVEELISLGAKLNQRTSCSYGRAFLPISLALHLRLFDVVSALLQAPGLDLNRKPEETAYYRLSNPIADAAFVASRLNDPAILEECLSRKDVDLSGMNQEAMPPLLTAIEWKWDNMIDLLLDRGANVSEVLKSGESLLMYITLRVLEIKYVRLLLERGADINYIDKRTRRTFLYTAVLRGDFEWVELALKFGADVNQPLTTSGDSIVMQAVGGQHDDILRILLEAGADPNRTQYMGYTGVHIAAWNDFPTALDLLLNHSKVKVHYDNQTDDKNTPLALACHGNHTDCVAMLLSFGCDVNNQDKDLDTPLIYATYNSNLTVVNMLLDHGADPRMKNRKNTSPLWNAVYRGCVPIVKRLLRENVKMEESSDGITQDAQSEDVVPIYDRPYSPLEVVLERGSSHTEVMMLLLAAGYDYGPEIETILNIVPTDENQQCLDLLLKYISRPLRLKKLCRNTIRRILGENVKTNVQDFEIPVDLKKYILFCDILGE